MDVLEVVHSRTRDAAKRISERGQRSARVALAPAETAEKLATSCLTQREPLIFWWGMGRQAFLCMSLMAGLPIYAEFPLSIASNCPTAAATHQTSLLSVVPASTLPLALPISTLSVLSDWFRARLWLSGPAAVTLVRAHACVQRHFNGRPVRA